MIGAGITGLAAAHRLVELAEAERRPLEVVLLEAAPRAGGAIGTVRRDGLVLELGPDCMITDRPWGLDLARRAGLEAELITTRGEHRRSFVVRKGRLYPVPEGFQLLAPARFAPLVTTPLFTPWGKARMACELLVPRRAPNGDESLGHFVRRRLGREALERLAGPMIAGIYGADADDLSLRATLPRFLEMEERYGSVIRGLWARSRQGGRDASGSGISGARYGLFVSFREGMQTLPDALLSRLPPGAFRPGCPVRSLVRVGDRWEVTLEDGERLDAGAVIVSLPAPAAARAVRPVDQPLSDLLGGIRYADAATVSLVWDRDQIAHPLDGFGFVAPREEGLAVLGCTFTQVKWPNRAPEGTAVLRAFFGHDRAGDTEGELVRAAVADLGRLLGITGAPRDRLVWQGRACMPQYAVGHLDRVAAIEERVAGLPGLFLAGNAYRGVGIPDSIRSGEEAAARAFARLREAAPR